MPGGGGSETTTNNHPPQYVMDAHQQNLQAGGLLADRPYQPYTGPRIAGWTPDQQAGMQMARNTATAQAPMGGAATVQATRTLQAYNPLQTGFGAGVATDIAQGFKPQQVAAQTLDGRDLSGYTNPWDSAVVDTSLADIRRQGDIAGNQMRARAAGAGAFGGSRSAILEAETERGFTDAMARTAAGLRQSGFTRAQDLATTDANRTLQAGMANQQADLQGAQIRLAAADQMARSSTARNNAVLGQTQGEIGAADALARSALARQQYGQNAAGMLTGVGQQQQGMNQANLDLAYQDFQRQYGFPAEQLQFRNGLLSTINAGSTGTSSTKTDNTGQLVGNGMMAAATVAAAYF